MVTHSHKTHINSEHKFTSARPHTNVCEHGHLLFFPSSSSSHYLPAPHIHIHTHAHTNSPPQKCQPPHRYISSHTLHRLAFKYQCWSTVLASRCLRCRVHMKDLSLCNGSKLQWVMVVTMQKVYEIERWTHRMTTVIREVRILSFIYLQKVL